MRVLQVAIATTVLLASAMVMSSRAARANLSFSIAQDCSTTIHALPPPGREWSVWFHEGTLRPERNHAVASLSCIPAALAQRSNGRTWNPPGVDGILSRQEWRGHGHVATVTLWRCASLSRCTHTAHAGRLVLLAQTQHAWLSTSTKHQPHTRVTWLEGRLRIRVASDLQPWWVERLAEHVVVSYYRAG